MPSKKRFSKEKRKSNIRTIDFYGFLKRLKQNKTFWILLGVLLIGAVLRFYNTEWDEGLFFHPDERNIAGAVLNIRPEDNDYNPDFFAYGTLPIYITRAFSGANFEQAILLGRSLSAFFSIIIIILTYILTNLILNKKSKKNEINTLPLIASAIIAFLPGMIQFAHFATFETFLTFEYMLIAIFSIKLFRTGKWYYYLLLGFVMGVADATKVVSLAMVPILFIAHGLIIFVQNYKRKKDIGWVIFRYVISPKLLFGVLFLVFFSIVLSPFNLLDYDAFEGALNYEGPVARGELIVFYTEQFKETIPFIYQYFKVFPFILGWPLTLIGFFALVKFTFLEAFDFLKFLFFKVKKYDGALLLTCLVTWAYASFHFTLYVKWTRYMVPLLPFMVIISIVFVGKFLEDKYVITKKLGEIILYSLLAFTVVHGLNYFSFYLKPDPRITASEWASSNLPNESIILSEIYDLGIIPWNSKFPVENITLYDIYKIDHPASTESVEELSLLLQDTDVIVLPSNRIYSSRSRLKDWYPNGYEFYRQLFDGSLGFELEARFTRNTVLGDLKEDILGYDIKDEFEYSFLDPDESYKVFDRPTILVFKRVD